jgi:hypothetical protein
MMVLNEYAKKYGVDATLAPMWRYADRQLALTTNQVDAAVIGYVNVGLMEEKGFGDYRVISGVFTGGQSLTLAIGKKATQWKDLEGLRIGTAPNSYVELLFKASARLGGPICQRYQLSASLRGRDLHHPQPRGGHFVRRSHRRRDGAPRPYQGDGTYQPVATA